MPDPQPLPIRVLVKGASLMHDTSARPQRREDFTFGRVIEESLLASGHGAAVWTAAVASEPMRLAFRSWEEQVKAWSPDVVILSYGYYETIHAILPRWLERHMHSLAARPGPIRARYRQHLLRPLWRVLARLQARVDRRLGARGFGRVTRRFRADLVEYITRTREVGEPLVMLFEFLPPGPRGQSWFPGMAARVEVMNDLLRDVVAEFDDPEVMLLPIPAIAAAHVPPGAEPNPDGFHYTTLLHDQIGRTIADEVRGWARTHPRLGPRRRGTIGSVTEEDAVDLEHLA